MSGIREAGLCSVCKREACVNPRVCYETIVIRNVPMNLFVTFKQAGLKPRKGAKRVH